MLYPRSKLRWALYQIIPLAEAPGHETLLDPFSSLSAEGLHLLYPRAPGSLVHINWEVEKGRVAVPLTRCLCCLYQGSAL